MHILNKIRDSLLSLNKSMCILFFIVMMIVIILRVIFRYLLSIGLVWAGEVTRYMLISIALFGASLNLINNEDVSLTFFLNKFGDKTRKMISYFNSFLMLLFLFSLLYSGYKFSLGGFNRLSPSMGVKMFWPYLIVPIATLLSIILKILTIIKDLGSDANDSTSS